MVASITPAIAPKSSRPPLLPAESPLFEATGGAAVAVAVPCEVIVTETVVDGSAVWTAVAEFATVAVSVRVTTTVGFAVAVAG